MPNTFPRDARVLVCDARKALIFRNAGNAAAPHLEVERTLHAPDNPRSSEQGSDRPDRVRTPSGRHSAQEPTDHHAAAEAAFAHEVAAELENHMKEAGAPLFVAAPPKFLAALRAAYGAATRAALKDEIDKDLTKQPVKEILKSLVRG